MKKLVKLAAVAAMCIVSASASAQLSVSGGLGYLKFVSGQGSTFGVNLAGSYAASEKIVGYGSLGYYFPKKTETSAYATSNNYSFSSSSASSIEVPLTQSSSFIGINAGVNYYLFTEVNDDFGFYAIGEIGLLLAPTSNEYGTYDTANYTLQEAESETATGFMMGIGLGTEFKVGPGFVFANAKVKIPANNVAVNGQTTAVAVEIPGHFALEAGYRIPLGE